MKAVAVIGANFGDEGKGRMVHHFVSKSTESSVIVVRYNGGAQAGHTVVRDDGVGHVFSHFGSGSLDGAPTFLSEFFIANPVIWSREQEQLKSIGVTPRLFVHPETPLTTPYDMFLNREIERSRGQKRHGSCGYGVSETVGRLCHTPHRLFMRDVADQQFESTVRAIRDRYVPDRLRQAGIQCPSDGMLQSVASSDLLETYLDTARAMRSATTEMKAPSLCAWGHIVFEGSQGLGLDESHRFFPHVTRSRTGLPNISQLCRQIGVREIEVVYVTRAYMTRHGAGPLPTESPGLVYEDRTNVPNEWQGALRFGHLDLDLMAENVQVDLAKAEGLRVSVSLAITCMDQVGDPVTVFQRGRYADIPKNNLPSVAAMAIGAERVYLSWNP